MGCFICIFFFIVDEGGAGGGSFGKEPVTPGGEGASHVRQLRCTSPGQSPGQGDRALGFGSLTIVHIFFNVVFEHTYVSTSRVHRLPAVSERAWSINVGREQQP